MVMYLSGQVCIVLLRRFEHNLGAIGELVRGEVNLSEASLAYKTTEGVVANSV